MRKLFDKSSRAIFGLSLGHFSVDFYGALLVPLYPLITGKLGISLALISSVIAFGHLVSSMLQPAFGYIADKLRHRFFMVWGIVLSSIFIPLTIKTNTVFLFMLFLMIGMAGNAFFHPQVSALVKDFNKNHPDLSSRMGIFLGLGTIGYAIGPYISTCTYKFGGESAFLCLSIFGLCACIFMYFFVPKMPQKEYYVKENFFKISAEILKNKACMYLLFIATVKSAVSISFGTYIPFLLEKQGFSINVIGLVVTLFFVFGALATMCSSVFEKKIGAKGVIVLSFMAVLPLTLMFLNAFSYSKILACTLFILCGFFILLSVSIVLIQAQEAMPKYTGVISGVMQGFSWGLGALFLSPLGLLAQNFGVKSVFLLMSALAFIVGLHGLFRKNITLN